MSLPSQPSRDAGAARARHRTIEQAPPQTQLNQPVQHVFVILKENHTYDNFLLSYPDPNEPSPPVQGLASNGQMVMITEPSKDDWSPGDNSFEVAHVDFDNGIMDGFDQDAHQPHPTGPRPVSSRRWQRRRLRELWRDIRGGPAARRLLLAPRRSGRAQRSLVYLRALSQSFPNHLYLLAATAGGVISNPGIASEVL